MKRMCKRLLELEPKCKGLEAWLKLQVSGTLTRLGD